MSETNQPVSGNDGQSKSPINSRPALHHDHAHLGRTHSSDTHLDDTTLPRLQNSEEQSPVATLIRQGRLAPAQRGWAERYYARDPEGFVQFASTQPVASIAGALPAANPDTVLLSEQQSQIARKLGLTHAQYASALSSSISLASDPLADATTGFRAAFNLGLHQAQPSWEKIAMMVPSTGAKETHAWLNSLPGMREWLGARVTSSTTRSAFTISNRLFEATVGVQRTEFEDDTIGTYTRAFEIMGANAAEWPDDLVWEIIRKGFSELCYDGKPFFAADHPWKDAAGKAGKASNLQTGTATPWYLFDTSKPAKALIFQQRVAPQLERRERGDDPNVFDKDQYLYGARARGNAGYGLWQLAWGSKADLTEANLNKAIETMMSLRHDYGRTAGVRPTLLVVPPSLRAKALSLVTVQNLANGASNPNFNAVEVHIEPRLA
ncbi:MAG: Mu-like prophage major head subunit gpT family protein [Pseudomonadota bacterium]